MSRRIPILDYGKRLYVRPQRQRAKPKLAEDNSDDAEAFERSSLCSEMFKRNNLPISVEKNFNLIVDRRWPTSLANAHVDSSTDDEKTPVQTTSQQNFRMFGHHFHQNAQDNSSESEDTEDDIVRGKTNRLTGLQTAETTEVLFQK